MAHHNQRTEESNECWCCTRVSIAIKRDCVQRQNIFLLCIWLMFSLLQLCMYMVHSHTTIVVSSFRMSRGVYLFGYDLDYFSAAYLRRPHYIWKKKYEKENWMALLLFYNRFCGLNWEKIVAGKYGCHWWPAIEFSVALGIAKAPHPHNNNNNRR